MYIYNIFVYIYISVSTIESRIESDYICIYVKLSTIAISNSLTRHVCRRATAGGTRGWSETWRVHRKTQKSGIFHQQSQGFTQPGYD